MKRLKRVAALLMAAVLTSGILAGCGEKPEEPPVVTTEVPERLTVCLGGALTSLDPIRTTKTQDMTVLCHLYENLLIPAVDENGAVTPAPGIAESWESKKNADGSVTYTFRLRSAKWSDGTSVLARDFEYAWKRLADPVTASPNARLLSIVKGFDEVQAGADIDTLQVKALGPSEFSVTITGSFDWFLREVCTAAATMPLQETVVQELKAAAIAKNQADAANGLPMTATWCSDYTKLVTNGPYHVESYDDASVTLVSSDFYWNEADRPARIRVVFNETAEAGWALHSAGVVDVLADVPAARLKELAQDAAWSPLPTLTTTLLLFNNNAAPLDDPLVRSALHLSVSRAALGSAVGAALIPATGFVPFGVSDPEDVDFRTHGGALIPSGPDEETAALATAGDQLLQAGYDEITPLPALELLYTDTERHAATARALAEQWMNRLNITVTPVAVTAEELNTALEVGTFSLALTDFTGYINDAQGFMDAWTTDSQTNTVGYSNTAYDTLLAVIGSAGSDQARRGCLHDAEDLLFRAVPFSPLYFVGTDYAVSDRLDGVIRSNRGVFRFTGVFRHLS